MKRLTLAQVRAEAKDARADCVSNIDRCYKWKRSRAPALLAIDEHGERLDRLMVDSWNFRMADVDRLIEDPTVFGVFLDSGVDFAETKMELECDYGIEHWSVEIWKRTP